MCRPVQLRMNKAQEVAFPWKTSFFLQRMRSAVPCIMQCRLPDTWCFPPFFFSLLFFFFCPRRATREPSGLCDHELVSSRIHTGRGQLDVHACSIIPSSIFHCLASQLARRSLTDPPNESRRYPYSPSLHTSVRLGVARPTMLQ